MNRVDAQELKRLYDRCTSLLDSLRGKPSQSRNRDAAVRYNMLRRDVKRLTKAANFDRLVPRAWYWTPVRDIPLGILALGLVEGVGYLLLSREAFRDLQGPVLAIGTIGAIVVAALLFFQQGSPLVSSTVEQVRDRASMLRDYLVELARGHPYLTVYSDQERQTQALEAQNDDLSTEVEDLRHELERSRELLSGFQSPSRFEVADDVLAKLDPLEKTRLLEAVQAYRVNAWTPAAAVCGMILEGWLQRLCRQNGIAQGSMRVMIERLGEAGLLQGYHDKLAQIGEFFRHRATHPTTEEFDREKTTLVLTSLVILIRDLF